MQAAADESKYVMDDFYLFGDLDDLDEAEDVEVPKALGDIFESIAGKNLRGINTKVIFFGQCSKMQIIPLQNFIIKTCFIQFLWFFRLKC